MPIIDTTGIRPIERQQPTEGMERVRRRDDGGGFRPQTNVNLKAAIKDIAATLGKIVAEEKTGLQRLPKEIGDVVKNILQQALSVESTLGKGIGSTIESQRFSMEQLVLFARMLSQMGTLSERGYSMRLSEETQALMTQFKAALVSQSGGEVLEPVLLMKSAFELVDAKTAEQLPPALYEILSHLAQVSMGTQQQQAQPQSESMQFLKQLIKFFMPRPGVDIPTEKQLKQQHQQGQRGQSPTSSRFLDSMFRTFGGRAQGQAQAQASPQGQPSTPQFQQGSQPSTTTPQSNQTNAPQGQQATFNQPTNAQGQQATFNQPNAQGQQATFNQPNAQGQQATFNQPTAQGQQTTFNQPTTAQGQQATFNQPTTAQGQQTTFNQPTAQGQQTTFNQPTTIQGQTTFNQPTNAQGQQTTFNQSTNAQGQQATFNQPTNAQGQQATFNQPTNAQGQQATFNQPTNAQGQQATFNQPTNAQGQQATFNQPTNAQGQQATFNQPTNAQGQQATFNQPTNAQGQQTTFNQPTAQGQQTTFNQPTNAQGQQATFNQPTNAQGQQTTFNQPTNAQGQQATFNQPTNAQGQQTTFNQPTNAQGQQATFNQPTNAQGQQTTFNQPTNAQGQQATFNQPTAPQGQQTTFNQPTTPQGQQATFNQPTTPQGQQATLNQPTAQGQQATFNQPTNAQGQQATFNQPTNAQGQQTTFNQPTNAQGQATTTQFNQQGTQAASTTPEIAQQEPLSKDFIARQRHMRAEMAFAKDSMIKQNLQNTPQTADAMKGLAQFLLRGMQMTPRDTALLQNFINNTPQTMNETEARHLQNLLRLCQQNVPLTVQQAAVQQKLPDLPRLWAFMQMCDLAMVASRINPKAYKRAGKDISDFANAMRRAMTAENSVVQDKRSFQMLMPIYMGEEKTTYPTYLSIYDEKERDEETGEDKKETWLRICVLTEYIGAAELVFRVYDETKLDLRFYFSRQDVAEEFRSIYLDDLQNSINKTALNIGEVRVGGGSERMFSF